ncbi:signal recognition particle, putative [Acanthamoeba castellanii str. Neff]|uniref:Signal recognition particle 14 kDa protein n=1 Tax=Acanthamoeba castellanii (strain ATCC 30010 / Neff) TaxID=1257118 RepID=L8HAH5_ACACF|nr:signal recognition particle, putative [Acanthamoeba castellanii str. Neff]ELR21713.1 signal recognition particle, putative [Acanthamoeba castellanii str. Neff]
MVLLTNQHFMDELTKLFQANKTKGSVWITMKRHEEKPPKEKTAAKGAAKPKPSTEHAADPEPKCLVRATNGKDIKISTVIRHEPRYARVASKDVVRFQLAFATLTKTNMDGLKKRERKGRRGNRKKVPTKHV